MENVMKCDFRIHDWIDGKYMVERVLGHSATDSKYKVVDRNGNHYMLKLLNLWMVDRARQAQMSRRSESEIESCIVPSRYLTNIVGRGSAWGNPYLVVEFTDSRDLSRIASARRPSNGVVLPQMAYGLMDLHNNGKVHGNLTPENVLVTADGRILLTNYVTLGDRCQELRRNACPGQRQMPASAAFVAPEHWHGERSATVLPTVDIYAFGVLTYQLLTGRLPFGVLNNADDYRRRALDGDWNSSTLGREAQRWRSFFDATLSPDPFSRPSDIKSVLDIIPVNIEAPYERAPRYPAYSTTPKNGIMLRVVQGENLNCLYRINELMGGRRVLTVGRGDDMTFNNLEVQEETSNYVSRRHCTIELDSETERYYVRDGQWDKDSPDGWVRSLNGTFLNSSVVTDEGKEIKPGDILALGDVKLRVECY